MKYVLTVLFITLFNSSFASSFNGEYEQNSGKECYLKLECSGDKCEAYMERDGLILKLTGEVKKDNGKKFKFLRKYDAVIERWLFDDDITKFDVLYITKKRNGSYEAKGSIESYNFFPFKPSGEQIEIECNNLKKIN
jgi:hypothetical protein